MNTTTHSLTFGTETIRFTPQVDGTVVVDHFFPRGLVGRPGVARMGKVMTRDAARAHYADALRAGWQKV